MSTTEFNLATFLSNPLPGIEHNFQDDAGSAEDIPREAWKEEGYEGEIDYRIRQLSYSSLLSLHTCPRKFQLYKLRSARADEDEKSTITFAFGHVVGEGIQLVLEGLPKEKIIWKMFLGWHAGLFAEDPKNMKSFWDAIIAIERFIALKEQGFLDEYELAYYNGKPACELSFCINLPDGFRLRGFVDAVLVHKVSGKILILEVKTTNAANINPATYKNSAQAIGYSVVLDVLYPDLSSYDVLYLVYQTKTREYTSIPFMKTYLQRALWIRELLLDVEMIKLYAREEIYPMHGESCVQFFRDCEYLTTCTLGTNYLTKPCKPEEEDKTEYQINLGLIDLLEAQIRKAENA